MAASDRFTNCVSKDHVYTKLITTICCDFLDEDSCRYRFRKFRSNCRLYLTTPRERNLSNAQEICDCLESKGKLGVGNYITLKELTSDVDNGIIELILAAEEKVNFLEGNVEHSNSKRRRTEWPTDVVASSFPEVKVDKLRETLLKINNYTARKTQISPLQKRGKNICVDLLYAPAVIKEDPGYQPSQGCYSAKDKVVDTNCEILRDLKEMFYKNGEPVRYIFMHGEAARGKTMYCKQLLKYWCNAQEFQLNKDEFSDEEKVLCEIDFAFFVSLRHVHQSRTSLEDMICFDLFRHNNECHDAIRHVLSSDRYKCLIIVDGLDEWRISKDKLLELTHDGLPNIETFSTCTCLFTFRPWKLEALANSISDLDRVVQILGLNEKSQNLVIDNVLRNYYEMKADSEELKRAKVLIDQKIRKLKVKSLLEIPLLATASIMLWQEKKDIGDNITSFYLALIQLLVRRALEQQNFGEIHHETLKSKGQLLKIPKILGAPRFKTLTDIAGFLSSLGKLAYHDLMSDETYLVFDKTDLIDKFGRDELDFALRVGLLSQYEAPGCFDEENVSISFFHKSVQEFLASFYVATTEDFQLISAKLSSIKSIMEMSNVCVYLSGLSSHLASKISQHIVRTANVDDGIRLARETFLDKYIDKLKSIYLFQVRCFQEMKYGETTSHDLKTEPITFHVGDICPPYACGEEIIKETVELLTHHYSSTVSLYLWFAPSVGKCCITDELLSQFLTNARCLQYLFIRGDRTMHHINETICLKSLHLASVKLPQAAIRGLQKSIESHRELRALTLRWIELIRNDEIENQAPLSLSDILNVLPQCTNLYMLWINYNTLFSCNIMVSKTFLSVLPQLKHLRRINYAGGVFLFNIFTDAPYDSSVLEILSKMPKLQYLFLYNINVNDKSRQLLLETPSLQYIQFDHVCLGKTSLQVSSTLSKLERISLKYVQMSDENWRSFISSFLRLNHNFDIHAENTYIDDGTYEMVRDSQHFLVTAYFSKQNLHFMRYLNKE